MLSRSHSRKWMSCFQAKKQPYSSIVPVTPTSQIQSQRIQAAQQMLSLSRPRSSTLPTLEILEVYYAVMAEQ